MLQRMLRPRVLVYSAILALLSIGMVVSLYFKPEFRVDVLRDRAVLSRYTNDGDIENVYTVKLQNDSESSRDFSLKVTGLPQAKVHLVDETALNHQLEGVQSFESRNIVVEVQVPDGSLKPGSHSLTFEVQDLQTGQVSREKSVFILSTN